MLIVKDFHKNYGGYYEKAYKNNVSWVGKIDWELQEFHGSDYAINNGSSQNAYLIEEEKTVLIDTAVWKPHSSEFIDNLESEIDLNKIDFLSYVITAKSITAVPCQL